MKSINTPVKKDGVLEREAKKKEIAEAVCNLLKEKHPDVSVHMAKRALEYAAIELESMTLLG